MTPEPHIPESLRPILSRYLASESGASMVILDHTLNIVWCNKGFKNHLEEPRQAAPGSAFSRLLLPESRSILSNVSPGEHHPFSLSFSPSPGVIISLHAHLYATREHLVILGEQPISTHHQLIDQLSRINSELINTTRELQRKKNELEHARQQISVLKGLLPICANCKNIRDEGGHWNSLETYIGSRSEASFTHSICPKCIETLYPGLTPKV